MENKYLSINHLYVSSPGVLMTGKPKQKAVGRPIFKSLLKKSLFEGCSKMSRCKAPEILSREAYILGTLSGEG